MTTHSLDSVLAAADASDQEIEGTNDETIVETEQDQEGTEQDQSDAADQGNDAHGALHAERNRVRRKYTETVADFERRLNETSEGFKKQLSDTLSERDRQWEQRFTQFAQAIQPRTYPPNTKRPASFPARRTNSRSDLCH